MKRLQLTTRALPAIALAGALGLALGAPLLADGGSYTFFEDSLVPPSQTQGIARGPLRMPAIEDGRIAGHLYDEFGEIQFELRGRLTLTQYPVEGDLRSGRVIGHLYDVDTPEEPYACLLGHWSETMPDHGRMQAAIYCREGLEYPVGWNLNGYLLAGAMTGYFDLGPAIEGDDAGATFGGGQIEKSLEEAWVGGRPIRVLHWRHAERITAMVGLHSDEGFEEPGADVGIWTMNWRLFD